SRIRSSAWPIDASARIVSGLPCARLPTVVATGSMPWASAFTTMSRSVSIPLSRSSSPQIGSTPMSSCSIRLAASMSDLYSPMHSQPSCIASRTVFAYLWATTHPLFSVTENPYPAQPRLTRLDLFASSEPEAQVLSRLHARSDLHRHACLESSTSKFPADGGLRAQHGPAR